MTAAPLTLVSVVFEAEFELQRLQARSIARYAPPSVIGAIVVIDNTARGLPAAKRDALIAEYGQLAVAVRVLRPGEITRVPGATGWRSQQVLKLAVAELIDTDSYVVLDAKNHLIAPLIAGFFLSDGGTPRANAYSYESHPLRKDLEHVLRYLGLEPRDHVPHFTATVTPFVFRTSAVRGMMRQISHASGNSFPDEFIGHDLTEFFLHAGWLIREHGSIDGDYDLSLQRSPVLWPKAATPEGTAAAIAEAAGATFFSVHRRALGTLDDESRELLATFWTDRALFADVAAARTFIANYTAVYDTLMRAQHRRDLPRKILALPRTLRRRFGGAPGGPENR